MKVKIIHVKSTLGHNLVAFYLFCFTAILSGSVVQSIQKSNLLTLLIFVTGILCCAILFLYERHRIIHISEALVLTWLVLLMGNSFIYPSDTLTNIGRFFYIIIAYYIANKYEKRTILKAFITFSVIVAIFAIIGTWLIKETHILDGLPTVININGTVYKFGLLYNYIPVIAQRVSGFFWEPGLLASCMIYASFAYGCIYIEKFSIKAIIILSILLFCCFITSSAAGYVLGIVCILSFFMKDTKGLKSNSMLFIFKYIVFILFILALANLDEILIVMDLQENYYIKKLMFGNIQESSRMLSIFRNLEGWLRQPIVGLGDTSARIFGDGVNSDTSTSTFLLSAYGIGGITYTIAVIYGSMKQRQMNIFLRTILCILLLAILNKEPHFGNMFTWVVIFMLLEKEPILENESIKSVS